MQRRDPKSMSANELDAYIKINDNTKAKQPKVLSSVQMSKVSYVETAEEIADHYHLNYNYLHPRIDDMKDTSRHGTEMTMTTVPNNNMNNNDYDYATMDKLRSENYELRMDIQKLFQLSDSNKKELELQLKHVTDENFCLKQQNTELKNQLLMNQNMMSCTDTDKQEAIKEKNIIRNSYEAEIIELNKQLTEYKCRLNKMTYDYQNLNENFNYWKDTQCRYKDMEYNEMNSMKRFFEEDTKNYIQQYEDDIDEIQKKLAYVENCNSEINLKLRGHCKESNSKNKMKTKGQLVTSPKGMMRKKQCLMSNTEQNIKKGLNNKSVYTNSNLTNNINESGMKLRKNHSYKNISTGLNRTANPSSSSMNQEKMYYLQDEMFALERKIAELSRNYQNFLNKLKDVPFTSFKENEEVKKSIKYISKMLKEKADRLVQLKQKQQEYLLQSVKRYDGN